MKDFEKIYDGNILIEVVNLSRATLKEAQEFKNVLEFDLLKKDQKIIIDLSKCEFMDSTFLGVLVVTLKRLTKMGGKLKIVEPALISHSVLTLTETLRIFDTFDSRRDAVNSFIGENNSKLNYSNIA